MDISEIISIAWNGVTSNKLRSVLTMLGVIIGVAAVIMVIAVSAGTEASIAAQIENLGTNLLFVTQNFTAGGPRTQTNATQNTLYYPMPPPSQPYPASRASKPNEIQVKPYSMAATPLIQFLW